MIKWLKEKIIRAMIEKYIAKWLNAFKAGNPRIWGIVAVILTIGKIAIEYLTGEGIIPIDAPWLEWIAWIIALCLGTNGAAQYKYQDILKSTDISPQKMIHLSDEEKLAALEDRNKVLEEIVRKA